MQIDGAASGNVPGSAVSAFLSAAWWELDLQTRALRCRAPASSALSAMTADAAMDDLFNLVHLEDRDVFTTAVVGLARGEGGAWRGEARLRQMDETYAWLRWAIELESGVDGQPVRVVATGADVSYEKALEEREQALRLLVPHALYRLKADGTIFEYQPPRAAQSLPATPPSLGQPLFDVLPAGIGEQARLALEQALQTGQRQDVVYAEIGPEGPSTFEASFQACGAEEVLVLVRDMTHLRPDDEVAARAETDARVGARGEFLRQAAHELRTPVTTLHASAQLLERMSAAGRCDPVQLNRLTSRIVQASTRLTRLMDDLVNGYLGG